jgi:hypothetical protein
METMAGVARDAYYSTASDPTFTFAGGYVEVKIVSNVIVIQKANTK